MTLARDGSAGPTGSTTSIGRAAEERAVRFLELHGYRIQARNVETGRGEIDIIAWHGETLCFIEVKARSSRDYGGAQRAVDEQKQRRLWKAAEAYLANDDQLWADQPECRFDVVAVAISKDLAPREWACGLFANAFGSGQDP